MSAATDGKNDLDTNAHGLNQELARCRGDHAALAQRFADVEQSYSALITLFVALSQLHASLEYVDVVRAINEILQNLIGARSFGLYLFDTSKKEVVRIKSQGCDAAEQAACDALAEEVVATGLLKVVDTDFAIGAPAAAIPLKINGESLGAIVLHRLLDHRAKIATHDIEILEVLGKSAAIALYGAKLHTLWKVERRSGLREGEVDLMPPPLSVNRRSIRP